MIRNHVFNAGKPSKPGLSVPNSQHRKHSGSTMTSAWWRACAEMVERMEAEAHAEQRAMLWLRDAPRRTRSRPGQSA